MDQTKKKLPACFHCNRLHRKCNQQRPCDNCIKYKKDCFLKCKDTNNKKDDGNKKKRSNPKTNKGNKKSKIVKNTEIKENSNPITNVNIIMQDIPTNNEIIESNNTDIVENFDNINNNNNQFNNIPIFEESEIFNNNNFYTLFSQDIIPKFQLFEDEFEENNNNNPNIFFNNNNNNNFQDPSLLSSNDSSLQKEIEKLRLENNQLRAKVHSLTNLSMNQIPQLYLPTQSKLAGTMYYFDRYENIDSDFNFHPEFIIIEKISENFCNFFKKSSQDIVGRRVSEFMPKLSQQYMQNRSNELVNLCINEVNNIRIIAYLLIDGTYFKIETKKTIFVENGRPSFGFSLVMDIQTLSHLDVFQEKDLQYKYLKID